MRFKALNAASRLRGVEWTDTPEGLLTFIVYLNDGFQGGDTAFLDDDVVAHPKPGRALLFQHQILHEGCQVLAGVKYVLRTDVMYRA